MWLQKGDIASTTRDPGRGGAVGGGLVGGIDGAAGHALIVVVEGTVVELAVPAMFGDVLGAKLVPETEDAVRTGFGGVKVVLRAFKGSKLFDRKVFREMFDREAGRIVGHSMCFQSVTCVSFNSLTFVADCSLSVDW